MPYSVSLPDGQSVEFPDEVSHEQAAEALKDHWAKISQPTPSMGKSLLHGAERGVAPAAAGLAAFGAGAEAGGIAGATLGPIGAGVGALAGGLGAGALAAYGASKAQEKILQSNPEIAAKIGQDPETQQAEQRAHPVASQIGEALPQFAAFRPSLAAFKSLKGLSGAAAQEIMDARKMTAANAVLGAGMDAGQQSVGDQPMDWKQVGISAALGAAASHETGLGKKLVGAGRSLIPGSKPTEIPSTPVDENLPAPAENLNTDPKSAILNHVNSSDVSSKKNIMEATSIPAPEVTKHLNTLKKEGLIKYDEEAKQWKPTDKAPEATKPVPAETPPAFDVHDLAADTSPRPPITADGVTATVPQEAVSQGPITGKPEGIQPPSASIAEPTPPAAEIARPETSRTLEVSESATAGPVTPHIPFPGETPSTESALPFEAPAHIPPVASLAPTTAEPVASFLDYKNQILDHINTNLKPTKTGMIGLTGLKEPKVREILNELKTEGKVQYNNTAKKWEPLHEPGPDTAGVSPPEAVGLKPAEPSGRLDVSVERQDAGDLSAERPVGDGVADTAADADRRDGGTQGQQSPVDRLELIKQAAEKRKQLADLDKEFPPEQSFPASVEMPKQVKKEAAPLPEKPKSQEDLDMEEYYRKREAQELAQPKVTIKKKREIGLRFDQPIGIDAGPVQGMSVKDAQDQINEMTKGWANKPDIQVHADTSTLPKETTGNQKIPANVRGISHGNTIHIIAGNIRSPTRLKAVLFHEALGHYGLRQLFDTNRNNIMKNIYDSNPYIKKAADNWLKAWGTEDLEHLSPEDQKAYATEEILAKASEHGIINNPGYQGAFHRIAAMVRNFLRQMGMKVDYSDNDVRQLLRQAHEQVTEGFRREVSDTGASLSKPAPGYKDRTFEEIRDGDAKGKGAYGNIYQEQYSKENLAQKIKQTFTTKAGFERGIKNFQDRMRPANRLTEHLKRSDKVDYTEAGFNALHDALVTAGGNAARVFREVHPDVDDLNTGMKAYAHKAGITGETAEKNLNLYRTVIHEVERRHTNYLENVPLDNTKKIPVGKTTMTPADKREEIKKVIYHTKTPMSDPVLQGLQKQLENLVTNHKDVNGYSPKKGPKGMSLDEQSPLYDVAGKYTENERKAMVAEYHNDPHQAEIKQVFDALNRIQDKTADFNRQANYRPPQLDNIIKFYGWKNYVPFKGDAGHNDQFEINGKRMSGELNQFAEKAEGRKTEAESPIFQTVRDAASAAGRLGRKDVSLAVKNLISQGHIPGKLKKTITFADRLNGLTIDDLQAPNKIFHYRPDGNIEIYSIHDKEMAESIKGTVDDLGKGWRTLNMINGTIGGLHTRYNPAFPGYNFVRHAMTASLMAGAENKPLLGAKYLAAVISKIGDGGLIRAAKMVHAYDNNDLAKVNDLAGKHSFYKNLKDYLDQGGRIEYYKNFNIKSQQENLVDSVKPSKGVLNTWGKVKAAFDLYNNMFELTGRAAGFGVMKQHYISEMKAAGQDVTSPEAIRGINLKTTAYVKNLFNYEQVGKYGREAGALYMFLRPSLTTAVRSLDAIAPAFKTVNDAVAQLPESIRSDSLALEAFRKNYANKQRSAKIVMAGMIGSGIALYHMALLGSDTDDQGRNKVADDDMALWTRNMRLPLFRGSTVGNDYVTLPWGFGLGSFGAFGAQVASIVEGHNTFKDALGNMIPIAMDSYFPAPVPKFNPVEHPIAFTITSMVPSFARPFIEYGMNVNEFGKQIYNDRTSAFSDAYTGGDYLPPLYGDATKFLADSTNGAIHIDPQTLHFFANSYFDGISRVAHDTYGIGQTLTGKKAFDVKRDIPVLDSFIGKSSSFDTREFAEISKEVAKKQNMLRMFKDNPDQLMKYQETHPNDEMVVKLYNQQMSMVHEANKQINAIQSDQNISGKEKAEMVKELRDQRDWTYRGIIDTVRDYE